MQIVATADHPDWHARKQVLEQRRRFQLARLISLSEDMLDSARAADWERVEELEVLRRVELEECFALQNEHPSLLIAQALATLIHINDQVVFLVRDARDRVAVAQRDEAAGLRAAHAYQLTAERG